MWRHPYVPNINHKAYWVLPEAPTGGPGEWGEATAPVGPTTAPEANPALPSRRIKMFKPQDHLYGHCLEQRTAVQRNADEAPNAPINAPGGTMCNSPRAEPLDSLAEHPRAVWPRPGGHGTAQDGTVTPPGCMANTSSQVQDKDTGNRQVTEGCFCLVVLQHSDLGHLTAGLTAGETFEEPSAFPTQGHMTLSSGCPPGGGSGPLPGTGDRYRAMKALPSALPPAPGPALTYRKGEGWLEDTTQKLAMG